LGPAPLTRRKGFRWEAV